jgi:outer membrane protein assembly factor BamB
MIGELKVFPHNLATSAPIVVGDLVFVCTSNGVDESHVKLPSPQAPSFIAVNKDTGKLAWQSNLPGDKILHGQWSSPAYGIINAQPQIVFGGGDGWAYGLKAGTGEMIWKFDLNPKDSVWKVNGRGTKNSIISTPVVYDNKAFLAVGQDPEHGDGPGHLYCIDTTKTGDITETGRVWHYGDDDYQRTLSTAAIADGLLYLPTLSGFLHCVDASTGRRLWVHDTYAAIWGSTAVIDGKVFTGTEDGEVVVLEHGRELKELAANDMGSSIYTTPVAANGVLYVTTRKLLIAVQQK